MNRYRLPLSMLVAAALFGSGWVVGRATADDDGGDATSRAPVPRTTTTVAPRLAPLTGLPDPSGVTAKRPALSVKVDNAASARPQSGIDQADLVYEEAVETGITRFLAVFQSRDPGEVGPVRSVRPMDPPLVAPLGGLVGYSGGIAQFVDKLHAAPVQDVGVDAVPTAYKRKKGRRAPSNLFATTSTLWNAARDTFSEPPAPLFAYLEPDEAFGDEVVRVEIPFAPGSKSSYAYDAASQTWKRSQNGTAHVTAAGKQIAPANVVVQFVKQRSLTVRDAAGNRVPESIVTGEGDAWLLTRGRIVKGRWVKADDRTPTRFLDAFGGPFRLTPGSTWVHLAPVGIAVDVTSPAPRTTTTAKAR